MMTPKKALVVDDSRSARYSLRKTLERMEMSVDCVESGENALSYLEAAKEGLPDIIFMDNLMPGLSGLDTTETINQDTRWRHIPVVMCTATQHNDQAEAETTAAGFLPKPATTNQIQALLSTLAPQAPADASSTADAETTASSVPKAALPESQTKPEQPSLIQGTAPSTTNQGTASDGAAKAASTDAQSGTPVSEQTNPTTQTAAPTPTPKAATPPIESSLDTLIDQLQGQLNGIEPRLLSLESAKHTLDNAIHQRLKEMHDQLVAHVHQLIDEAIQKHEGPNLDSEVLKTQITATVDEVLGEKIAPVQSQLREEMDAQSRHIEHRLMGEVVETDHVIEQATAAATQAAQLKASELIAQQPPVDENTIKALLADTEQTLIQRAEQAAEKAAIQKADKVAAREAEKIACQQAEKAVSDNLNRLQRQISQSAQAQINDAVKKQQIMGLAGFGIAVIALVLSVVL